MNAPEAAAASRAQMLTEQYLPVIGTPDDLSTAVKFLCFPVSDFVTGQVLNADGGWAHT